MKTNLALYQKRITTGFLLAPLISCALATVAWTVFDTIFDRGLSLSTFENMRLFIYSNLLIFLLFTSIAYIIILFLGIPFFMFLKYLNRLNVSSILISAYIASVIGLSIISWITFQDPSILSDKFEFLILFPAHLITLLGAFIFWWIAIRPAEHQL